jgi:hypothetical protein
MPGVEGGGIESRPTYIVWDVVGLHSPLAKNLGRILLEIDNQNR